MAALASLFIVYTVTVIGGVTWLNSKFNSVKKEILEDFDAKHKDNAIVVKALETLVIRHDVILNPEWRSEAANRQLRTGRPS